ncbi:MAG: glycosyltransferase, partial [Myxococcota bacterium]
YRDDALELMGSVDVVAHCSLRPDPFPTVVLEAMALGRARVATWTRGPEEAAPADTAVLVDPGDAEALSGAIGSLVTDDAGRRELGARARAVVGERFGARLMAERFERLYATLAPEAVRA